MSRVSPACRVSIFTVRVAWQRVACWLLRVGACWSGARSVLRVLGATVCLVFRVSGRVGDRRVSGRVVGKIVILILGSRS